MTALRNVPVKELRESLEHYEWQARKAKRTADRITARDHVAAIQKELALREAESLARSRRLVRG